MNKNIIKNALISSLIPTFCFAVILGILDLYLRDDYLVVLSLIVFISGIISNFIYSYMFNRRMLDIVIEDETAKIIGFGTIFMIIITPFLHGAKIGYAIIASTFLAVIGYVVFIKK